MKSFGWARLIAWAALVVIPFAAMGPAVGKVGLALDDWFIWRAALENQWLGADTQRPLALFPMFLAHALAGNDLTVLFAFIILLHAVAAILLYELIRLVLAQDLPRSAPFLAAAVAAIFVIYPSDVSRYWATASVGTRFVTIEVLSAALLWMLAVQLRRPQIALVALVPGILTLLRTESGIGIIALLPLLTFARRSTPWRAPWRFVSAVWYCALVAYVVWHVRFATTAPFWGRFGPNAIDIRPLQVASPFVMAGWYVSSLYAMTIETARFAFEQAAESLGASSAATFLIAGGIGLGIALILWLSSGARSGASEIAARVNERGCLRTVLWSFLVTCAGLAPFMLDGARHLGARIPANGVFSRYSAVGSLGVSALLVTLTLVPIFLPLRPGLRRPNPLVNLVCAAALCAFVVTLGIVRLTEAGANYERAWSEQKAMLRAMIRKSALWQRGTLVVLDGFPRLVSKAPLTDQSWAYRSALGLFLSPPPSQLFLTADPNDFWLLPDDADETAGWRISDGELSVKWYLRERLRFSMHNVVVVRYDVETQSISPLDTFPTELLPAGTPRVALYTGPNRPAPERRVTAAASELLGPPVPAQRCEAEEAVRSPDAARIQGTVAAFSVPSGVLLDRRYVAAGSALNYQFYAPCGTKVVLTFDPGLPHFVDQLGATEHVRPTWTAARDGQRSTIAVRLSDLPATKGNGRVP